MFTKIKSKLQAFTKIFSNTKCAVLEKLSHFKPNSFSNDSLEDLERLLFEADLGAEIVHKFLKRLRARNRNLQTLDGERILQELKFFAEELLQQDLPKSVVTSHPHVIIMVGMNGSGKTTSVAKLSYYFSQMGKRVLLVAADTFRAAAVSQLSIWSEKLQLPIVKGQMGGDPAAVLHDGLTRAKNKDIDIVLVDTAGRLESKKNLMQELAKMRKVSANVIPGAPHENVLVLDASIGQHAIGHAKAFHAVMPLTGLIVTKIEGSTKGGVILNIYDQLRVPVQYLGIGEQIEDLIEFDSTSYINSLFSISKSR